MRARLAALAITGMFVLGLAGCDDMPRVRPAADFRLPLLTQPQQFLSLSSFRGKVVYLDVWASWCHPCLQAMPELNRMRNALAPAGFEILAVNIDAEPSEGAAALARIPVDYPVVSDMDSRILADYGIDGVPTAFLIDRSGWVRHVVRGFRSKELADIDRRIGVLLDE
ncbi:MAG: TlpA disulfide reductase family protein [Gammaproteobacteria bacterium]|jgi:thiol-disulfide isomerase/thioredoxin